MTQLTLKELKKLDIGSWKHRRYTGERIATLDEALTEFQNTQCTPVIEIKDPRATEKIIEIVKRRKLTKKVCIIAFSEDIIKTISTKAPEINCAWLCSKYPENCHTDAQRVEFLLVKRKQLGCKFVNLGYPMTSAGVVSGLQKNGCRVWCWTVNSLPVMQQLHRWNIDGITSDYPDVLFKNFKSQAAATR